MYVNNFSIRILHGVELPGGYVELDHKTQYILVLRNARCTRCDARVEIDGKFVGTWRIEQQDSITIERPAHDPGRFTFYKVDTVEAFQASINQHDPNTGLIKVTFTPERDVPINPDEGSHYLDSADFLDFAEGYRPLDEPFSVEKKCNSEAYPHFSAGGTGLSGKSEQKFSAAEEIVHDYSQQTVIHLRLIVRDKDEPRPLTALSTPIPPPTF